MAPFLSRLRRVGGTPEPRLLTYAIPTQAQRASNETGANVVDATPSSSVVEQQQNMLEVGGSTPSLATLALDDVRTVGQGEVAGYRSSGPSRSSDATAQRKRFYWNEPLGDPACPYLYRTVLDLGRFGSIRMHRWLRGDETRARHDHPQDFLTLVVWGSYIDDTADGQDKLGFGSIRFRKAEHIHTVITDGCWTLLYFWPKRREWGFWSPNRRGNGLRWFSHRSWHAWMGNVPCE